MGSYLTTRHASFDSRNYGFSKLIALARAQSGLEVAQDAGSAPMVRLRPTKESAKESSREPAAKAPEKPSEQAPAAPEQAAASEVESAEEAPPADRKSTRLNSSHPV